MKKSTKALTIRIFVCINIILTSLTYAQKVHKKDTLYYLIDLHKIPINDRMLSRDTEGTYHFYQVNCFCSDSGQNLRFLCDEKTNVVLSKRKLSMIGLISLPNLIERIKKSGYRQFKNNVVLYFIEPDKKNYNKFEVHLLEDRKMKVVY